jgi:hypothetical protein
MVSPQKWTGASGCTKGLKVRSGKGLLGAASPCACWLAAGVNVPPKVHMLEIKFPMQQCWEVGLLRCDWVMRVLSLGIN